jgi:hypothetical protein
VLQPGHATIFLPQHNGSALIEANDVERVLANIDADDGDTGAVLLSGCAPCRGAPCQPRSLAGQEHGGTIPLAGIRITVRRLDGGCSLLESALFLESPVTVPTAYLCWSAT